MRYRAYVIRQYDGVGWVDVVADNEEEVYKKLYSETDTRRSIFWDEEIVKTDFYVDKIIRLED